MSEWITAAAIASLIAVVVANYWEHRKLNRAEKIDAYAAFLSVFSRRWRAFGDRDGARKRGDLTELASLDERVTALRDDLYEAYTRIQMLGSQDVVEKAIELIRLGDDRNRSFKTNGAVPGVGVDRKQAAIAAFVRAARKDTGQAELDVFKLRSRPQASTVDGYPVEEGNSR